MLEARLIGIVAVSITSQQALRQQNHDSRRFAHRTDAIAGPGKWQVTGAPGYSEHPQTFVDYVGRNYERAGYLFVPLLRKVYGVSCSLDILFLRRDSPGAL